MIQSDDWGRIGIRNHSAFKELQAAGLSLGTHPYDFYSLETAEDVEALRQVLLDHSDSAGRSPAMVMNFVTANLDFEGMRARDDGRIMLRPLDGGFPGAWSRPGLFSAYRLGIADGCFRPGLHGTTHFCRRAMERELAACGPRATLLRTLWRTETPYIFSRMPWVGYEYWDADRPPKERALSATEQLELVQEGVNNFGDVFGRAPLSACAPGYRASYDTHEAWVRSGIKVAQNGPASLGAPHLSEDGLLLTYRNVNFEPATDPNFSVAKCLRHASKCFAHGVPAVVSVHSINFHSTLRDFRSPTLAALDNFLGELEKAYPGLLYINDADLLAIVTDGSFQGPAEGVKVKANYSALQATMVPVS